MYIEVRCEASIRAIINYPFGQEKRYVWRIVLMKYVYQDWVPDCLLRTPVRGIHIHSCQEFDKIFVTHAK